MKPRSYNSNDRRTQDLGELAMRRAEEDEEQRVYFIAPGYLTKFDRDCGEGANLASVYVIDASEAPASRLQLAQPGRDDRAAPLERGAGGAGISSREVHWHANMLNFLLVPADKVPQSGGPVLIFVMYKSVFLHAGLMPYAHKPAFAHTLSRFIDIQVLAG